MKKLLILILLCFGCSRQPQLSTTSSVITLEQARIGDVITDINGHKYKKLTNEKLTNGVGVIDIWEKIDPPVTNKWYTPTLSSKVLKNTIEFNSLYRGEGENP